MTEDARRQVGGLDEELLDKRIRHGWFPFHGDAWQSDALVKTLSYEQRGVYLELLINQWREGSIPADPKAIAASLQIPAGQFRLQIWSKLEAAFPLMKHDPGRRQNRRLEIERLITKNNKRAASARARRRTFGED